ncbi:Velvet complex subunit RYP3 [Exophiala dermatitidis]
MPANVPPPSPSQSSEANDDANFNIQGPPPVSRVWEGRAWALEVVQQPIRARMCGFGDKDRRPISPPPCIRLIIFDPQTGEEIDYEKVADLSRLVLNVDLWNLQGSREDNCVKHNTSSPSISSVVATAYPHAMAASTPGSALPTYNIANIPALSSQAFTSPTAATAPPPAPSAYNGNNNEDPRAQTNGHLGYAQRGPPYPYPQYQNGYEQPYHSRASTVGSISSGSQLRSARSSQDLGGPPRETAIAKNLIGSASSSAFRLKDDKGKVGLWFVLQDLSVRTEGWFRLKMNFFNLSEFILSEGDTSGTLQNPELFSEAPCLATAFSRPFKVYSAKKFPGVIETTELNRQFAKQGIKIPIRKVDTNNSKKRKGVDDDDYDSNGEDV